MDLFIGSIFEKMGSVMLNFGDEQQNYATLITKGKYAGRIYYCKRPFDLGEMRYYLGGDRSDWVYFGGAPELPDTVLKAEIDKIVASRKRFLENHVRQNQDLALVIYDRQDGTWQIMKRRQSE